jgi:polyisoprenoid-binding protein YceI
MENQKWVLDPTHSEVYFKVKHLVISTVTGYFREFGGSIETKDESFVGAVAQFEAKIDSIDTNNADRDGHLKSDDFFAAAEFPSLLIKNATFSSTGENTFDVEATLNLRGVEKSISLKAEKGGVMVDPYGQTKAGFEINGKINRKDFGLNWSAVTEAGGIVVSDEVRLVASVQFVKQ